MAPVTTKDKKQKKKAEPLPEEEESAPFVSEVAVEEDGDKEDHPSASTAAAPAATLLSYFWDLAAIAPAKRISAAHALLKYIIPSQQSYMSLASESEWKVRCTTFRKLTRSFDWSTLDSSHQPIIVSSLRDANDPIDPICSRDVSYTLKRLLRGLTSSREGARQGFTLALTEVLRLLQPHVTLCGMLQLLWRYTQPTEKTGQAQREVVYGRVFGCLALIRADLVASPDLEWEELQFLVDQLTLFALQKSFVRGLVAQVLLSLTDSVDTNAPKLSSKLNECILSKWENMKETPEYLAMQLHWDKSSEVLKGQSSSHLSAVLRETTQQHPRLHMIWPLIVQHLLKMPVQEMHSFWLQCIDTTLVQSNKHELKYVAFSLIEMMAEKLSLTDAQHFSPLLSPALLRCLANTLSSKETYLHKAAQHLLEHLSKIAENNPSFRLRLLMTLETEPSLRRSMQSLNSNGNNNGKWDAETASSYQRYLEQLYASQPCLMHWCMDQMLQLARHGHEQQQILLFLATKAYFESSPKSLLVQQKFQQCLSELMKSEPQQPWLVRGVQLLEEMKLKLSLTEAFDKEEEKLLEQTLKVWRRLLKQQENNEHLKALVILMSAEMIQFYSKEERENGKQPLQDLMDCAKRLSGSAKKDKDVTLHPVDVLVDLMMSQLTRDSSLMRRAVETAFGAFVQDLSAVSMQCLLDVIVADDEGEGEEEEDDDEDDEEIEEDDSEVEQDQSDSGSDAGESDVDEMFRQQVESLIHNKKSNDDESDEEHNDEQMAQVDASLAALFAQKKAMKQQRRDQARQQIHFRCRVLDLWQLICKKNPAHPQLSLSLVPMLMTLKRAMLKGSKAQQWQQRLMRYLLQDLSQIRAVPEPTSQVDNYEALMEKALQTVLQFASRAATDAALMRVTSQLSLYLSRILRGLGKQEMIHSAYSEALKEFLSRHGWLSLQVFEDLIQRHVSDAWMALSEPLTDILLCKTEHRRFVLQSALQLALLLMRHVPAEMNTTKLQNAMMTLLITSLEKQDNVLPLNKSWLRPLVQIMRKGTWPLAATLKESVLEKSLTECAAPVKPFLLQLKQLTEASKSKMVVVEAELVPVEAEKVDLKRKKEKKEKSNKKVKSS